MEFKLIPADEIPERPDIKRGWFKIIKEFVKSGEKFAYIQFDTKEEMRKAGGGLSGSGSRYKVKVSQRTHLLRIYFEKL